jgi:hypothetical protein
LLLGLLHGTNPKQRTLPRTLSSYFQRNVSHTPITGDFCLHKDSSRRSIASGDERDRLYPAQDSLATLRRRRA